jgi:hypothetical protein
MTRTPSYQSSTIKSLKLLCAPLKSSLHSLLLPDPLSTYLHTIIHPPLPPSPHPTPKVLLPRPSTPLSILVPPRLIPLTPTALFPPRLLKTPLVNCPLLFVFAILLPPPPPEPCHAFALSETRPCSAAAGTPPRPSLSQSASHTTPSRHSFQPKSRRKKKYITRLPPPLGCFVHSFSLAAIDLPCPSPALRSQPRVCRGRTILRRVCRAPSVDKF